MADTVDPQTMRATEPAAPSAIDPKILEALNDPNNPVIRESLAKGTQQGGWGDPNKTFVENVLDRGRQVVNSIDTIGGRMPPSSKYGGGMVDPSTLIPPSVGAGVGTTAAGLLGPAGTGVGPALMRVATAAGGGYGGESLFGSGNPTAAALESGLGQAVGEAGGVGANKILAHKQATHLELTDSVKIPAAIRSEVSAFDVRNPNDVQALGVTGGKKLSAWYQIGTSGLIKESGDPTINVPALAELKAALLPAKPQALTQTPQTGAGPTSSNPEMAAKLGISTTAGVKGKPGAGAGVGPVGPIPGELGGSQMKLSEALKFIQSSGEAAFAGARTPESVQMRQLWRQAQQEITDSLPPALRARYSQMRDEYGTGLAIIDAIKSRPDGSIFTRVGPRVTFNRAPDANGGTPLQRAIYESFGDARTPTNMAVHRGGDPGTGDAIVKGLLQNLWLRAQGHSVLPGASMHGGVPGTPAFAGTQQPAYVPPAVSTAAGQRVGQAAGGLLSLSPNKEP